MGVFRQPLKMSGISEQILVDVQLKGGLGELMGRFMERDKEEQEASRFYFNLLQLGEENLLGFHKICQAQFKAFNGLCEGHGHWVDLRLGKFMLPFLVWLRECQVACEA